MTKRCPTGKHKKGNKCVAKDIASWKYEIDGGGTGRIIQNENDELMLVMDEPANVDIDEEYLKNYVYEHRSQNRMRVKVPLFSEEGTEGISLHEIE